MYIERRPGSPGTLYARSILRAEIKVKADHYRRTEKQTMLPDLSLQQMTPLARRMCG